jgi:hypothetical protein
VTDTLGATGTPASVGARTWLHFAMGVRTGRSSVLLRARTSGPALTKTAHQLVPRVLEPPNAPTVFAGAGFIDLLAVERHVARAGRSESRAGRTNSSIAALNLPGSSTNGSWPDSSNQTSSFEGAVSASKYATLVSDGTQ